MPRKAVYSPEEGYQRKLWARYNFGCRTKGIAELAFDEWKSYWETRRAIAAANKSARQTKRKQVSGRHPPGEYKASALNILTPAKIKSDTMEREPVERHMLDKIVRHENAIGPMFNTGGGWVSLGNGCAWKTNKWSGR